MPFTYAGRFGPETFETSSRRLLKNTAITVKIAGTNTNATLYTSHTKATGAPNPFTTDANGNGSFYADPGDYTLTYNGVALGSIVTVEPHPLEPLGGGGAVDDTPYGAGWNNSLLAASQNALYDKFESLVLGADPASVFNVQDYASSAAAAAAANAYVALAGNTGALLYWPPGAYTSPDLVTVNAEVSIYGPGAQLKFTTAGSGLHIPIPRDAIYCGLVVNGNDVALGTDATGVGIDALIKFGTEHDSEFGTKPPDTHIPGFGEGAKVYIVNMTARQVGPGGTAIAFHNLQNSDVFSLRSEACELGARGWLFDNGCKNINVFGGWPTNVGTGVELNTSAGPQRVSKINFIGGLTEEVDVGFKIMDAEQITLRNWGINPSATAGAAIHCLAGGNRDTNDDGTGDGAKGPSFILVEDIQIGGSASEQFVSGLRLDTAVTVQVGGWSVSAVSGSLYKVENATARITETRPHWNEPTTRYISAAGHAEQTVVRRPVPQRTVTLSTGPVTLTDMPAAATEINGSLGYRTPVDLSRYTHVRLAASVITGSVGGAGNKLQLKYKTTGTGVFTDFLTIGTSEVETALANANQVKSAWIPLVSGAKADVYLTLGTIGGGGTADAVVGNIIAEFY